MIVFPTIENDVLGSKRRFHTESASFVETCHAMVMEALQGVGLVMERVRLRKDEGFVVMESQKSSQRVNVGIQAAPLHRRIGTTFVLHG